MCGEMIWLCKKHYWESKNDDYYATKKCDNTFTKCDVCTGYVKEKNERP